MSDGAPEESRVLYLFCVARTGAALKPAAGEPLFIYACGGLAAVCGWADMLDWSEPGIEERMGDLKWVTPQVMRHEATIEAAMRVSPVLPARLGTLFSSIHALHRFLIAHHAAIAAFLTRTEDKQEWAVKAALDRARAGAWLAAQMAAQQAPSGGGAGYLRARRARIAAAREISHWAAQTLEPIVEQLRGRAAACYQRGAGVSAPATAPQPLLNLAFLVAREKLAAFRRCVEDATRANAERGLELSISGPWPPYSFCPSLEMPP